jgi:hypothetical protein
LTLSVYLDGRIDGKSAFRPVGVTAVLVYSVRHILWFARHEIQETSKET